MVASPEKELSDERMKICTMLWDARISVSRRERGEDPSVVLCVCVVHRENFGSGFLPFFLISQAEFPYKKNSKFLTQIQYCEDKNIPLMVVVGGEEKEKGGVKVRDVSQRTEVEKLHVTVCF